MSWVIDEAKKIFPHKDRIILENPKTVEELDNLIINDLYPFIEAELIKTNLPYYPTESEIRIESKWDGGDLGRSLLFMLMDESGSLFFRGVITLSKAGYMLEREFFLELPLNTNPEYIFKILGDDKFAGLPPTLEIQNSKIIITFKSGKGLGGTDEGIIDIAKSDIESVIQNNITMFKSTIDGFSTSSDVDRFLEIAYLSYEAY